MAKFILDGNIPKLEESDEDIQLDNQQLLNYRGDHDDSDEEEQRYYEFNAHFPYEYVYKKLENLLSIMSLERKGLNENTIQDNFRRNANECSKEKLMQRLGNDKVCFVLTKNINLREKITCSAEKNKKVSHESSLNNYLPGAFPENSGIYSLISNAKSRNVNGNFKQGLATLNDKQITMVRTSSRNIPISLAPKVGKRQSNSSFSGKIPIRKMEESKRIEGPNMFTSYTNYLKSPKKNGLVNKSKNIQSKQNADGKDSHICSNVLPNSVSIAYVQNVNVTGRFINKVERSECGLSQSKLKVKTSESHPVATLIRVDADNILLKSETKENIPNQKNNHKSTSINIITGTMTNLKGKPGRNQNIKHLNPQNTKIMTKSSQIINLRNSSVAGTHQVKNTTDREANQVDLNRIQERVNKNDWNKNLTLPIATKEEKKGHDILNINITKVENTKSISLSPPKIQEINHIKNKEDSKCTEGDNEIYLAESKENTAIVDSLSKVFSSVNKKAEKKSRNMQMNNLTQMKSNIYSEREKAHSIHSGSYHSNHMLTQAVPKTIIATTVIEGSKPIVKNESLSNDRSVIKPKTFLTKNSMAIHTQKVEKSSIEVKKILKVGCNLHSLKKTLNTAVNNAFAFQKKIKVTPIVINPEQKNTVNEPKIILESKKKIEESNTLQVNTESTHSEIKHALFNTNSTLKNSNSSKNKPVQQAKYIKIDSSKLKTKSNSVNSNASNGINSSGNSLGKCLVKNQNDKKNPKKISNGSYLNLKKNEFIGPNDKNAFAVKSIVSPASSSSLEKFSTCTNGTSAMKKTPTEKSIK